MFDRPRQTVEHASADGSAVAPSRYKAPAIPSFYNNLDKRNTSRRERESAIAGQAVVPHRPDVVPHDPRAGRAADFSRIAAAPGKEVAPVTNSPSPLASSHGPWRVAGADLFKGGVEQLVAALGEVSRFRA